MLGSHWSHLGMNAVALIAGYSVFWSVIGVDPSVRRQPPVGRIGLMAALLLGIGYLAVVIGSVNTVLGEGFYAALGSSTWPPNNRTRANLLWALGEMPVLVVLMATVAQWARADDRAAAREDTEPDLSPITTCSPNSPTRLIVEQQDSIARHADVYAGRVEQLRVH